MAVSPLTGSDGVLALEIKSNGTKIADTATVISVAIRAEMMRIPEAVIVLEDGDVASGEFPLADADTFVPGAEIEIRPATATRHWRRSSRASSSRCGSRSTGARRG